MQLRHLRDDNSLVVGFSHTYDRMNNKLSEVKLHSLENSETYAYDSAYGLLSFERSQTEDSGLLESAEGQTETTLFDPAQSWEPDQWLERKVRIVAGPGVGQVRNIVSNTDMVLTVDEPWVELPGPGTEYEIFRAGLEPDNPLWALDGVGNWDLVDDTENWQHTAFNEITSFGPGGTVVQSDDNGNETSDGTFTFQYDFQNRLRVSASMGGSVVGVYSYDAAGRRIRQVVSNSGGLDGTTDFYLDGSQEIEERDEFDSLVQQYVFGISIDEALVFDHNMDGTGGTTDPGDRRLFYHPNTLGSVFALTDSTGEVEEGYLYDAYGTQTVYAPGADGVVSFGGDDDIAVGAVSVVLNPFLFTGRRFDGETDLYYYRARYLDPEQGRFIQRDPSGLDSDSNLYRYVGNSPTNATDSSGLQRRDPDLQRAYKEWEREQSEKAIKELEKRFISWYETEKKNMAWLKALPPVPKELEFKKVTKKINPGGLGGRRDPGPFVVEVTEPVLPEGYDWDSEFAMNILGYHPNARYGIRSKEPSPGGAGNQAMYDARGKLITGGLSAGTADKTSPKKGWGHQSPDDVVPFDWAWKLDRYYGGKKFRYMYIEVRPSNAPKDAPENIRHYRK